MTWVAAKAEEDLATKYEKTNTVLIDNKKELGHRLQKQLQLARFQIAIIKNIL